MSIVVVNRTSHGLHLLMTLLTGGLWIPVWIWRTLVNRRAVLSEPSVVVNNSVTSTSSAAPPPGTEHAPRSDDDPLFKMT